MTDQMEKFQKPKVLEGRVIPKVDQPEVMRRTELEQARGRVEALEKVRKANWDKSEDWHWEWEERKRGGRAQLSKVRQVSTWAGDQEGLQKDLDEARAVLAQRTSEVAWWPEGRLITVHIPGEAPEGGLRGEVMGFSRASRRRLIQSMARVRRDALPPKFITLTWPKLIDNSLSGSELSVRVAQQKRLCEECREALVRWQKALRRRFPRAAGYWRLEIQPSRALKRSEYAPHFHLLIYGIAYIPVNKRVIGGEKWNLQDSWNDALGQESLNSVDLEVLKTSEGAMSYAAKYLGKPEDIEKTCKQTGLEEGEVRSRLMTYGRTWGVMARSEMPWAEELVEEMSWEVAQELCEAFGDDQEIRTGFRPEPGRMPRSILVQDPMMMSEVVKAKDVKSSYKLFIGLSNPENMKKTTKQQKA